MCPNFQLNFIYIIANREYNNNYDVHDSNNKLIEN